MRKTLFFTGSKSCAGLHTLLLTAVLTVLSLPVAAQGSTDIHDSNKPRASKTADFTDRLVLDFNAGIGTKSGGVTPVDINVNAGYRFIPRAYIFARAGGMFGLGEERDGIKTYTRSPLLGGGLGYSIGRTDGNICMEARGSVAASVGNADWKQTVYDVSLIFKLGKCRSKIYFGLGYRHISSHTRGADGYNGLLGTVGFGF